MGLLDILSRVGKAATSPLLPEVANSGAALEQEISRPRLSDADHPLLAALRGFGAGAVKGAGNVAANETSPLSLMATMAGGAAPRLSGASGASSLAADADPLVAELAARGESGSRIAQGGFKLPEPRAVPSPSRMAEMYKKFGMVDPSDTYSPSITDQLLNGR